MLKPVLCNWLPVEPMAFISYDFYFYYLAQATTKVVSFALKKTPGVKQKKNSRKRKMDDDNIYEEDGN